MTLVEILPWIAAVLVILTAIGVTLNDGIGGKGIWRLPALACILFLAWSIFAVLTEGQTGFWPEHIRNRWGNQIWFDLLLAVSIGWALIVPAAKAQGMKLWGWLAFVICTGCIGFLAMYARLLYLKGKAAASPGSSAL